MSKDTILKYMIENDLKDNQEYTISNHLEESPGKINVKADEVIYIDKIAINPLNSIFFLEFHSATDSRIIRTENCELISRHKGHIYFLSKEIEKYTVSYIKLKIISYQ